MNKTSKITMLLTLLVIALPILALAGPGFNGNVNDGGADCPVDGGLSILLVAGIGYGAKKMAEMKKKAKAEK